MHIYYKVHVNPVKTNTKNQRKTLRSSLFVAFNRLSGVCREKKGCSALLVQVAGYKLGLSPPPPNESGEVVCKTLKRSMMTPNLLVYLDWDKRTEKNMGKMGDPYLARMLVRTREVVLRNN